jgi:hypothetical protein
MTNADVLAALNAERYGPSLWWKADRPDLPAPPPQMPTWDDSDTTTARRRKALADEYGRTKGSAA